MHFGRSVAIAILGALTALACSGCGFGSGGGEPESGAGVAAADVDTDRDGLSNGMEAQLATDPTNPDTDGDGVTDGAELTRGSDPKVAEDADEPPADGGEAGSAAAVDKAAGDMAKVKGAGAATVGGGGRSGAGSGRESLWIGTVTDSSEDSATRQLKALCTNDFSVSFRFQADDSDDEWKLTVEDVDDSTVTYVNLDDAADLEVDHPANDFTLPTPAAPYEEHRASITYAKPLLSVAIDGTTVVSGFDVGDYDHCLHLKIDVDNGVTVSKLNVSHK